METTAKRMNDLPYGPFNFIVAQPELHLLMFAPADFVHLHATAKLGKKFHVF